MQTATTTELPVKDKLMSVEEIVKIQEDRQRANNDAQLERFYNVLSFETINKLLLDNEGQKTCRLLFNNYNFEFYETKLLERMRHIHTVSQYFGYSFYWFVESPRIYNIIITNKQYICNTSQYRKVE